MKMSEYTRGEWKKMKDKPFKERLEFFWDYYKIPTIIVAVVVLALVYTATVWISAKDEVLNGILVNSVIPEEEPAFVQDFYEVAQLNPKKQEVVMVTGLSLVSDTASMGYMSYQRIHAGVAAKETDFLVSDESGFRQCAYDSSRMLKDLRELFTPEQLAQLEGRLYYIDGSLLQRDYTGQEQEISYPSPSEPEKMADPIPVGINICDCEAFLKSYYSTNQPLYFAVIVNAPHEDRTLQFFEFIMEHTNKE